MHTEFWLENLVDSDRFEDIGVGGRTVLKWIFNKRGGGLWRECVWFRTGTVDEFLLRRYWTFGLN
jgi:hypothetical protein